MKDDRKIINRTYTVVDITVAKADTVSIEREHGKYYLYDTNGNCLNEHTPFSTLTETVADLKAWCADRGYQWHGLRHMSTFWR